MAQAEPCLAGSACAVSGGRKFRPDIHPELQTLDRGRTVAMRRPFTSSMVGLVALLVFSRAAPAQTAQSQLTQANEARSPWKFNPTDRPVADGGPAPKRDLTGTWAGPGSGLVPQFVSETETPEKPSLTPMGQQLMSQNKPLRPYSPAGTGRPP